MKTLIALCALITLATSVASAATITLNGTKAYAEGGLVIYYFDTSSLAGQTLEGFQFSSTSAAPYGTALALMALDPDGEEHSIYLTHLDSSSTFPEIGEDGRLTGGYLIEPYLGRVINTPFVTPLEEGEIMDALFWGNSHLGERWQFQMGLSSTGVGTAFNELSFTAFTNSVPEPSRMAFLGLTFGALIIRRRRM